MRNGTLLFILAAGLGGADPHLRLARVTLAEGPVEVEQATGERQAGERNMSVAQGVWIETGAAGRTEITLDDGGRVRLGPASLAELSDLTRLSTGQRITVVSLERGMVYATAEPASLDAFLVVAPGVELTFLGRARLRVEAGESTTTVAALEGRVRFTSRVAELDLSEGQTLAIDPGSRDRFQLYREVIPAGLDSWSLERDRLPAERIAPETAAGGRAARRTRVGTTRVIPAAADLAFQAEVPEPAGIRIVGADPPPVIPPAPPATGSTYYYTPPPLLPPPVFVAPPEPVYYPVYVPSVVVVEEPRRGRRGPGESGYRGRPAPTGAPPPAQPKTPPGPAPQPKAAPPEAAPPEAAPPAPPQAPAEGPEHRVRIRNPEGNDTPIRRR